MIQVELHEPRNKQVTVTTTESWVIQHRTVGTDHWPQEAGPYPSPEEALTVMSEHAHWYAPGNIRVVRKRTTATVEVQIVEVLT